MARVETFVVRVFVPAGDEKLELTGVVEHSGTGRSEHFNGIDGLLGVVLHQLGRDLPSRLLPSSDEVEETR